MLRPGRSTILLAILLAVTLATAGCVTQNATTSSSTETTIAAGTGAAEALQTAADYKKAMTDWVDAYMVPAETRSDQLVFADPLQPTAAEIEQARSFAASLRDALTALREISAPPEIAQAHSQFCTSFNGELTALDRMITGIEAKSQRDIELAIRMWEEALALEDQAMRALDPYVDLTSVIQN
jgi:hypothetical protein